MITLICAQQIDSRSTGQRATIVLDVRCNREAIKIPNFDIDVFKVSALIVSAYSFSYSALYSFVSIQGLFVTNWVPVRTIGSIKTFGEEILFAYRISE